MFAASFVVLCACVAAETDASSPGEIFARRILPLARAPRASSCTECHFGGVDLKQYILDDAAQTFSALRAAGLIDVEKPADSKLLTFIGRKPEKPDPVLAKVREEEYAAFKNWIEAAVRDPSILNAPAPAKTVGSPLPIEVVRHARHDRVLQSFVENIWVEKDRCAGCHSSDRNQKQVKQHGEQMSWISPNDPAGTLATIIANDLINVDEPEKSLILQKPLNQVKHGGHIKFNVGGRSDRQFRRFLNDYAAIVKGTYQSAGDLPPTPGEVHIATGQHLRVVDLPPELVSLPIRVDLYSATNAGDERLVGTADGRIGDKLLWQNIVFAVVPREADIAKRILESRQLPAGRYRAKVYVDRNKKIESNRDYVMTDADLLGTIPFEGPWASGYQPPKILSYNDLVK